MDLEPAKVPVYTTLGSVNHLGLGYRLACEVERLL